MALRAKNNLGFINGTLSKPLNFADELFEVWARCNDVVVSWIHNAISPNVRSSVAFMDDASEI